MSAVAISELFYVSGGTMPEEALSYVERAADRHLLGSLLGGKFCYVLNSRQMGKSSMCVRTKKKLEEQGVRTAFIDLTKIGGKNVSVEQWYAGLIVEVGRALNLRSELLQHWNDNAHLSPMQRFFGGLREVVLERIQSPVVIFIDEIDSTRSLPFDTDEFFAGIRECYNRRVHDRIYARLAFCLLGVAVPSDLIRNAQTTPFNIGERVYLKDFTLEETSALAKGLPGRESLVNRIHYWTHGHPFLTQSLCTAIRNDSSIKSDADVDALVSSEFFEPKARETNINLADVGNRVLNGYGEGDDIAKFRADILSAYEKVCKGKTDLQDDESNRTTAVLKLSGLMRSEGKSLRVRNPIYARVFGKDWIHENMPGQELRRQRKAFFVGVLRTAFVAAAVIGVIGYLAVANHSLALKAEAEALQNRYQAYVATMNLMPVVYEQKNITRMRLLLDAHAGESWKGQEWFYWDRIAHQAFAESPATGQAAAFALSPDHQQLVLSDRGKLIFLDAHDAHFVRDVQTGLKGTFAPCWLAGGKAIVMASTTGGGAVVDASDGHAIRSIPPDFTLTSRFPSNSGKWLIGYIHNDLGLLNLETMNFRSLHMEPNGGAFTPDDSFVAVAVDHRINTVVELFDMNSLALLRSIPVPHGYGRIVFLPDGKHFLFGGQDGHLALVDAATGQINWDIKVADAPISSVTCSDDGNFAAVTPRDRSSHLYAIGITKHELLRSFAEANSAMILPNHLGYVTHYWNIKIYRLNERDPVVKLPMPDRGAGQAFRRFDGKDYLTSVVGDSAMAYELRDGKISLLKTIPNPKNVIMGSSNSFWLVRTQGNEIVVSDGLRQKDLLSVKSNASNVPMANVGTDKVALCLDGRTVDLWDISSNKILHSLKWPARINYIQHDDQYKQIAVEDETDRIGMIDIPSWTIHWTNSGTDLGHGQPIKQSRFSRDGTLYVTAADDDTAMLWDTATGKRLATFSGHAQSVTDADITPDNRRVATVSDDQTVRLWDAKTGLELTTLGSSGRNPRICMFTSDAKYLVTGDRTNLIKLWPMTSR